MFRRKIITKPSFTLIEIILVIFIILSVYYLAVTNFTLLDKNKKENISLINIKSLLLKYQYKDSVELKCIEDGKRCLVFVDGIFYEELKEQLFNEQPEVYTYDKNLDMVEYKELELEKLERFEVVFEYLIDKYNKTRDMIVKSNNKVYIFNSINKKPIVVDYLSDVNDYFDDKISEVKDAF